MGHTRLQAPSHRYGPDDQPVLVKASENTWIIGGNTSSRRNGDELVSTCAAAKRAKPYKSKLTDTNRLTIMLLPGIYDLGNSTLNLDTLYIDLVGVSTNTGSLVNTSPLSYGDTVIKSNNAVATVIQAISDIHLQNLCLLNTNSAAVVIKMTGASAATIWRNLLIYNTNGASNFGLSTGHTWAGFFEDVRCWNDRSWGGFNDTTCSGVWIRCKAGGYSFAGWGASCVASGTFIDCEADGVSFGGTASGKFIRCRYVNVHGVSGALFGTAGTASGLFVDCIGNDVDDCFGATVASGVFINCRTSAAVTPTGRGFAQYTGTFSGVAEGCVAGNYSFASNGTFSGTARGCRITNTVNPFNPATFTGTIMYCDFPGWFNRPPLTNRVADLTLVPANNDNPFTNRGATGQVIFTLPTPQVAMKFTFFVVAAQNLRVVATTGVTIRIGAGVTAAAGRIDNATVGGYVELTALSTTEWYGVEGVAGAWALT